MKNIESLAKKTKVKMHDRFIKEKEAIDEEEKHAHHQSKHKDHHKPRKDSDYERQNDYFKEQYSKSKSNHEQPEVRRRVQAGPKEEQIHASHIDPVLYNNPNADKEVLNLVDSQFGQGFLELNFDDDEPETQVKKPLSNPGKKVQKQDQFDFGGPKSVKNPKQSPGKFEFDNYESQYSTAANKKNKQPIFDDDYEVETKKKPAIKRSSCDQDEDDFNKGFDGFDNFNNFASDAKPSNPYIQESEVYNRKKPQKEEDPLQSNLQSKGFNDDFLNFDLLGDVD